MREADRISHEIVYPHGIDLVWEALTDPEQLAAWLMDNDFVPQPGHRFTFYDHEPWPDGKIYNIDCDVISCDPPRQLSYSWSSPPKHGRTIVTWNLEPVEAGTLVRLTHSGFAQHGARGREAFDLLNNGWGGLLADELARWLASRSGVASSAGDLKPREGAAR